MKKLLITLGCTALFAGLIGLPTGIAQDAEGGAEQAGQDRPERPKKDKAAKGDRANRGLYKAVLTEEQAAELKTLLTKVKTGGLSEAERTEVKTKIKAIKTEAKAALEPLSDEEKAALMKAFMEKRRGDKRKKRKAENEADEAGNNEGAADADPAGEQM